MRKFALYTLVMIPVLAIVLGVVSNTAFDDQTGAWVPFLSMFVPALLGLVVPTFIFMTVDGKADLLGLLAACFAGGAFLGLFVAGITQDELSGTTYDPTPSVYASVNLPWIGYAVALASYLVSALVLMVIHDVE